MTPSYNPFFSTIVLMSLFVCVFLKSSLLLLLILPLVVYFIVSYRFSLFKCIVMYLFVVVLFLCIRFVAYSGENIDFQVQFILAYRWYLIFFMGVLAARMMRVNHIFYLFDKVKLFILCVPFVVAFRVLPKIKEDLEISNKAAIVRGMNKRSLYCVWHKFQSIVFVIVMSLISFVDEYSLQLHARGVNRGLQVFFIKDKMKAHELFVLFYLLMILIYVLGGS